MDEQQVLHPAVRGLKVICRCNNVKYRTIERAICDGARTLAGIAARTSATTGHCGGSCTPEVQQMLADLAPHAAPPPAAAPSSAKPDVWWVRKK
ncbi:MAG TPA: (2Fe-2S)-binding protein [Thermoanaerobaculia bacterium]|nr:(2Fe-2S)-binding protein [Thermoanaerobaculia bacterium]